MLKSEGFKGFKFKVEIMLKVICPQGGGGGGEMYKNYESKRMDCREDNVMHGFEDT